MIQVPLPRGESVDLVVKVGDPIHESVIHWDGRRIQHRHTRFRIGDIGRQQPKGDGVEAGCERRRSVAIRLRHTSPIGRGSPGRILVRRLVWLLTIEELT